MPDQPHHRIRGIIFDIGDVLYDASAWRRWLTKRLVGEGVRITYPELVERWEAQLVDVYCGRAAYWDRFDALLDEVGLVRDRRTTVRADAQQMALDVQFDRKPMPGVPETLALLREEGVRLAGLSDTESGEPSVRKVLDQLGIEPLFDAVVTSADIGTVKPDVRAYAAAADALRIPIKSCAFVGHDVDELEGAQAAGLLAVAFNYHPDAPADLFIDEFSELADIVRHSVSEEL